MDQPTQDQPTPDQPTPDPPIDPPTQSFRIANVLYTVTILDDKMDSINTEINIIQDEILGLRTQLLKSTSDLAFQQKQLLTLYILETVHFQNNL